MLLACGPVFGLEFFAILYGLYAVPTVIGVLSMAARLRAGARRLGILAMLSLCWAGLLGGSTLATSLMERGSIFPGAVPLAVIMLAVSISSVATLAHFPARPPLPGFCAGCGYNLTGNVSGICPECGRAAASAGSLR